MKYGRRYLQFNSLVFDTYDMIRDVDASQVKTKTSTTDRNYGHGRYVAFKKKSQYIDESTISMTLRLHMKKMPCETRPFYRRYVVGELMKPGVLWAVQNNELIWTFAYVSNYNEQPTTESDTLEIDIDFVLYQGIWHKADKQKTFLLPYDVCLFMECKGYKDIQPCKDVRIGDCCTSCLDRRTDKLLEEGCECCCCDEITKDMALCYYTDELQSFYNECDPTGYQVVYDCQKGEKFFGDKYLGQKICNDVSCNESVIAGTFYADTDIPTTGISLIITGTMHNPWITINGNTNIIEGDYEGALVVKPNGDIYHVTDCCETLLDPSVWIRPTNMNYGWEVEQGNNGIVINMNTCCKGCVYIQLDNLTI